MSISPPETTSAVLMSNGSNRPTWHRYSSSRYVKDGSGNHIGIEDLFKCTATGAVRAWGVRRVER